MALDYINCLFEFTYYFILFLSLSGVSAKKQNVLIYSIFSLLTSLLFIFDITPLFVNLALYILIAVIAFRNNYKENLMYSAVCCLLVIFLQFMFFSILPSSLLQTNFGNLINNLCVLLAIFSIYFFSNKYKLPLILRPLILNHKLLVLVILFFSCFLGQFYLSRLSVFWTYLPGLVSLFMFLLATIVICVYVYHVRSANRLQVQLLMRNIENTENYITSLRMQNHDYKHHLANLRNQVSTSDDLNTLKENIHNYINQMDQDRAFENSILNISQPVLRAALYGCYTKCKQNNIDFQFSTTDLLPNFPLKDFQLVEIMENLTANAIEHNMTLPSIERKLSISFYALDGRNEITVTNPVRDIQMDLSDMLKYGYSSKDSNHSGLGLFNIKQLADQNKLQFYGKRSDKYVSFTLLYMEESLI